MRPRLPAIKKSIQKMTPDGSAYALRKYAEFWPPAQVRDGLREKYGIDISFAGLSRFAQAHAAEIEHIRAGWLARLADEPATNKRVRLRELWSLYQDLQQRYAQAERDDTRSATALAREMRSTLEAIRQEVEGTRIQVSGSILHTMDDGALIEEAEEVLRLRAIEADWQELPDPDKEKT